MAQFSSIIDGDYYFLQILIFIVVPFLYLIFKKFKTIDPPFPPGPTPWPIVGNIPQMVGKLPHVAMADLSKVHGPLMSLRLGCQNAVVASSPAAAKEILKTHDRLLSARYVIKSLPINQEERNESSIAMNDTCGDRWNYLRSLCRAGLNTVKALDAQTSSRERKMVEMVEYLKARNEGDVVNIQQLVFDTFFSIMNNILLSTDRVGFDENGDEDRMVRDLFRKMLEGFSVPNISDVYPILSKFDLQGTRKTMIVWRRRIEAIYEPIFEKRRKSGAFSAKQNDFLDVLLQNKFTNAGIFQFLLEMYTGAIAAPTVTVEWAMAELMKSPESMKKVICELESEVGITRLVKESHLVKLPYLQACIKETLRLHPPGPLLVPHRAPESCQVMNYTIPKNAAVYINVWAMGRDPSIWRDPLTFKPERFLNATVDFKGNDLEYIPFGGGRRICPGLPMAVRQVPLILATLLHSFDWSLAAEGTSSQELDMSEKAGISLHIAQPLLLIPKSRK